MTIQKQDYLDRINYKGMVAPNEIILSQLHQAHLYTVPFEDLNIHYQIPIVLEDNALFEKVVNRNRGGFCYELNGLFKQLLDSIGFQTTLISARVIDKQGVVGVPFDHAALIVDLEQRWLVDVGFGGDSFVWPKELVLDKIQKDVHEYYKFTKYNEKEWLLMHSKDGKNFRGQYVFSFESQVLQNFESECQRKQLDAGGHFRKNLICTMATPTGRISILNDRLTIKENGNKMFREIENEEKLKAILVGKFSIPTHQFIYKRK